MNNAVEIAKRCGIQYRAIPAGTTEMFGSDRQIATFAERIRELERKACAEHLEIQADRFSSGGGWTIASILREEAKKLRASLK